MIKEATFGVRLVFFMATALMIMEGTITHLFLMVKMISCIINFFTLRGMDHVQPSIVNLIRILSILDEFKNTLLAFRNLGIKYFEHMSRSHPLMIAFSSTIEQQYTKLYKLALMEEITLDEVLSFLPYLLKVHGLVNFIFGFENKDNIPIVHSIFSPCFMDALTTIIDLAIFMHGIIEGVVKGACLDIFLIVVLKNSNLIHLHFSYFFS